ncbi:MAG: hypothetical protein U0263_30595 [Polyangiaceae bacterium]
MNRALFVERADRTGSPQRKEIYLKAGRLHRVASTDRSELLGEYLVRRNAISREQLETALGALSRFGGRLGDTVIGLGYVEAVDVFRAIRDPRARSRSGPVYVESVAPAVCSIAARLPLTWSSPSTSTSRAP